MTENNQESVQKNKCKWRDDFSAVCVNYDSPHCADFCPYDRDNDCKHAE